jgi:hypothetical protein
MDTWLASLAPQGMPARPQGTDAVQAGVGS